MRKKHTLEYVKQFFEDQGCELLEEGYINAHIKMKYKCSCGNISEICFNKFQQGRRCNKCGIKRMTEKRRHSFKFVKQYFKDNNCELLEKEYVNNFNKMKYQCICGSISKINFNNFKQGKRCAKCGGTEKFTLEYAKQYFKAQRCKLLEKEYINISTKMKYRCSCGNISEIAFNNFKQGQRCKNVAL